MTSNINVSAINTTTPVVGTRISASDERNSRVAIKDGLQTAATEITALQNEVANISGGGNFTGIVNFTDGGGFTGNVTGNNLSLTLQYANATQDGQVTASKFTEWTNKGSSNLTIGNTSIHAFAGDLGAGAVSNITALQGDMSNHTGNIMNPHGVNKAQVGLSNVTDVTPLELPVSNATQTALNTKQGTLISGTNIKTINGVTILGSGDMVISGGNVSGITGFTDGGGFTGTITDNNLSLILQNANATQAGQVTAGKYTDWENKGTSNLTLGSTGTTALKGNATTADVVASTDKNYVTDAGLTVLNQTSGTNTGDQDLSGLVTKSTTVNGVNLSSNVTLTTANITASTDKNYITDAKLTVLNQTSNTNTGDQDLSALALKSTTINGVNLSSNITLTTANISASTDKQYVTDANLAVINVTSGANTGDNATNTQYSGLVSNANHTGDATGSTVLTLATVNNNAGVFGNATIVPIVTVNAKGLVTNVTNVTIAGGSGTVTDVTATTPVVSSGGASPNISMEAATSSVNGYMTSTYAGKLDSIAENSNVTYVQGNGTVNGITLTGNVTGGGNLTLGGTLSAVNLSTQTTGTLPVANGGTGVTSSTGSGNNVLSTSPNITTPILGTPQSGNLSSCTGYPITGAVTGNTTGVTTLTANGVTSAQLAAWTTDETGTGSNVFANNCTLNTPNITTPSFANLTSAISLPLTTGVTGILPVANGGVDQTAWSSWTPTLVNITLGNGTLSCSYKKITEKTVAFRFQLTAGSTTVIGASLPTFTLPVTASSSILVSSQIGDLIINDVSVPLKYSGSGIFESTTTCGLYIGYSNSTYDYIGAVIASVPILIANGDIITVHGVFEAA